MIRGSAMLVRVKKGMPLFCAMFMKGSMSHVPREIWNDSSESGGKFCVRKGRLRKK